MAEKEKDKGLIVYCEIKTQLKDYNDYVLQQWKHRKILTISFWNVEKKTPSCMIFYFISYTIGWVRVKKIKFLEIFLNILLISQTKKKECVAMNVGEFLTCGEPCEDVYCHKHIAQIKTLGWLPRACKVCGVGVINTYCKTCILETREREQNILLAKEFEDDEPSVGSFGWNLKNQDVKGACTQSLHE